MQRIHVLLILGSLILSSCGGSGIDKESQDQTKPATSNASEFDHLYRQLRYANATDKGLKAYSGATLENYFRDGLRLYLARAQNTETVIETGTISGWWDRKWDIDVLTGDDASYDGRYWYIPVTETVDFFNLAPHNGFKIVDTLDKPVIVAEYLDTYPSQGFTDRLGYLEGHQPRFVSCNYYGSPDYDWDYCSEQGNNSMYSYVLKRKPKDYPCKPVEDIYFITADSSITKPSGQPKPSSVVTLSHLSPHYPFETKGIQIQSVNLENTDSPRLEWNMEIEGREVLNFKVNNTLYVVTQRNIHGWKGLEQEPNGIQNLAVIRQKNEAQLQTLKADQVLSRYRVNGEDKLLTDSCHFQQPANEGFGYINYLYITAVDLNTHSQKTQCIAGDTEILNHSNTAIYTSQSTTTPSNGSVFHKFDLTAGNVRYAATGTVEGLVYSPMNLYANDDSLTVVHAVGEQAKLSVLEPVGERLELISSIPNDAKPEPIFTGFQPSAIAVSEDAAQVGSRIFHPQYSPRHFSSQLYPHVDLSNRADPKYVPAEFEPPEITWTGRAEQIAVPIGEGLALRVVDEWLGKHVVANTIELIALTETGAEVVDSIQLSGVSVYADNETVRMMYKDDDTLRILMPSSPGTFIYSHLEVSGIQSNNPSVRLTGKTLGREIPQTITDVLTGLDIKNLLVDGNRMFFTYGSTSWKGSWDSPAEFIGPLEDVECKGGAAPGIEIEVIAEGSAIDHVCDIDFQVSGVNVEGDYALKPVGQTAKNSCSYVGAEGASGWHRMQMSIAGDVFQAYRVKWEQEPRENVYPYTTLCGAAPDRITLKLTELIQ